jgi:hypothetical protein
MKKYKYRLAVVFDSFTVYYAGNTKKDIENEIKLIQEVGRIKYIYNANSQFGFQNRKEVNTKKEIYQFIKSL